MFMNSYLPMESMLRLSLCLSSRRQQLEDEMAIINERVQNLGKNRLCPLHTSGHYFGSKGSDTHAHI